MGKTEYSNIPSKEDWLRKIMNEYGERLTKLSYTYVKDWGKAEDIVQEVFITCFNKSEEIGQINSFKAWIYRITINRCKDALRSSVFKKILVDNGLIKTIQSPEKAPELQLLSKNDSERLARCIIALPLKYREIIILFYYEGLSIVEICDLLDTNKNTIKSRLRRGRELIKIRFERSEQNGR